jgi:hypothetical protein
VVDINPHIPSICKDINVYIDLDNVTFPWWQQLANFIKREAQTTNSLTCPRSWDFWDQWGLQRDEFLQWHLLFARDGGFGTGTPIDGSLLFLQRISKAVRNVTFVTDRAVFDVPTNELVRADTIQWCELWFPGTDVQITGEKLKYVLAQQEMDDRPFFIFDDKTDTIRQFNEHTPGSGILYGAAWNTLAASLDTSFYQWWRFEQKLLKGT